MTITTMGALKDLGPLLPLFCVLAGVAFCLIYLLLSSSGGGGRRIRMLTLVSELEATRLENERLRKAMYHGVKGRPREGGGVLHGAVPRPHTPLAQQPVHTTGHSNDEPTVATREAPRRHAAHGMPIAPGAPAVAARITPIAKLPEALARQRSVVAQAAQERARMAAEIQKPRPVINAPLSHPIIILPPGTDLDRRTSHPKASRGVRDLGEARELRDAREEARRLRETIQRLEADERDRAGELAHLRGDLVQLSTALVRAQTALSEQLGRGLSSAATVHDFALRPVSGQSNSHSRSSADGETPSAPMNRIAS